MNRYCESGYQVNTRESILRELKSGVICGVDFSNSVIVAIVLRFTLGS
jgi:hypothetical protein